MARLSEEEIEAVFGHEAGHVRHHHLVLRVLTMAAPVSLWLLAQEISPYATNWLWPNAIEGGIGLHVETGILLLAAMALYVLVVFGYCSRLLEHQADLFGCRLLSAGREQPPAAVLSSALEKLAAGNGIGRHSRGWQHASIARRVDFLSQVLQDPKRGLSFQRRVLWTGSLVLGIVLSPVVYRFLCG